ncbi:MAG TPA: pantoate--beta-alanine ligase, partial [Terriglobales bacterium]|nr:pantoate--beta-alanine ligase [Terriglobales bacterium]
ALHAGHLSLVRAARSRCDVVMASIFVNPTQFGPHEDFGKYPRTLEADSAQLVQENVDLLFAPSTDEMYPPGATTFVEVAELSDRLDGKSRPGHFRGVATIVNKLFHIVQPDFAFFGQKDAAQCAVIRRMVRDLRIPVEIVVCPIVRESDGLAMSSRNAYLSADERKQALVLHRALEAVLTAYQSGEREISRLRNTAQAAFAQEPSVVVDYIEIVDADMLVQRAPLVTGGELVAVAAKVGATRLIDNIVLPK